jgi:hypothetical protein
MSGILNTVQCHALEGRVRMYIFDHADIDP